MQFVLALLILWSLVVVESKLNQPFGCSRADHAACDELCKIDSFWYGNCKAWNGKDFQCSCFPYRKPLDGSVCRNMHDFCTRNCQQKGSEGGYCYPQSTFNNQRGIPTCTCFGKFMA